MSGLTPETVLLRNGTEEGEIMVKSALFSLDQLAKAHFVALYELAALCRDPKHTLWGDTSDILQRLSLVMPDGRVHESIRNVVLSAVTGEGADMALRNPIA